MSEILITGRDSFIGKSIIPELKKNGYCLDAIGHKDLDLLNINQLEKFFKEESYDIIINCAFCGGSYKENTQQTYENNINILLNLLKCRNSYNKLFIFGSGIEFQNEVPRNMKYYQAAKIVSTILAKNENKIINLRLFGCFGKNENSCRFISTCLRNYINKQDIHIFEDKFFDFLYIKDLAKILGYLICHVPNKYFELDCVYNKKFTLSKIAYIINNLSDHKGNINIDKKSKEDYTGNGKKLKEMNLSLIGLRDGILDMHKEILSGKN